MAINLKDYTLVSQNISISKKSIQKFLFDFRIEGKRFREVVDLAKRDGWRKQDYVREAQRLFSDVRKSKEIGLNSMGINASTKLDDAYKMWFNTLDHTKGWVFTKDSFYQRYVKGSLGSKAIGKIQEHHIQSIIRKLQMDGMATRTQRTTIEVLSPLFTWCIRNKAISDDPTKFITLKKENTKKPVTNATEKFKRIFTGINEFYKDSPFYRALFLFSFTGRRKGEVLKLKWENVDFKNNYYWIEGTKNNEKQKYALPNFIKEALLQIPDNRNGLVFKSPITGVMIKNTDRQMGQLKKYLGMPELTMHFMRNVLVSALAEGGIEAVTLSGILGHRDIHTINQYLSLSYHTSSKKGNEAIGKIIDVEVVE